MSAVWDLVETCRPAFFYGAIGIALVLVGVSDRVVTGRWRA